MTDNIKKPGCITSFLLLFRISKKPAVPEALPYRVRDDFLSPAEFSFYKVLSGLVGTRLMIQTKVGLVDIFFVARPNENMSFFNRISQKHVDFLLCEASTMKPLMAIELDDSSHVRDDRRQRDDFINKVFQSARLPLLHVAAQREYNSGEIASQIAAILKDKIATSTVSTTSTSAPTVQYRSNDSQSLVAPICPKCGIPMVLRISSQGGNRGKQFYGCQNYPHCREMKPITIHKNTN